ncbi:MAG TPA: CBS domain-containing protein [Acidiferrobacterales bacterium]|jgi:CBS domain-containing protein
MPIGDLCNREVIFAHRDDSITAAAELMRRHHVGDLIVADERDGLRVPVGILTDRDLVVEILAKGVALDAVNVGDIMTTELLTARESDDTYDTIARMRNGGVRRMPVVDAHGALTGIIAVDDLLDLLAEELGSLARLVARGQAREHHRRRG